MATVARLRKIMPNLSEERAALFAPRLDRARAQFGIDTPLREAAFLAQLAHESGEFKYMEEIASGEAYEGRVDLGNTHPGDGKRFKGRGVLQITGRSNYVKVGVALGYDLISNPELLSQIGLGCLAAGWFWKTHGLNELADAMDFLTITKRINGGTKGLASRKAYYARALKVLGAA